MAFMTFSLEQNSTIEIAEQKSSQERHLVFENQIGPKAKKKNDLAFMLNLSEVVMSGSAKDDADETPEAKFMKDHL